MPGETRSPFVTSGFRAGTPALTTRGFDAEDCRRVGGLIADVVDAPQDATVRVETCEAVAELCAANPLYA